MLKKLLEQKGVSVYRAARECGLPYTTVNELVLGKKALPACSYKTVAALAAYFSLSPDAFIAMAADDTAPEINPTWLNAKKRSYRFPVKYGSDAYDASRIHPLKQKAALAVYDRLRDNPNLLSLILFGSAPTICCRADSDLDFAVALRPEAVSREIKNEVSEQLQEACGYSADILWMDRVNKQSTLYKNILKGVKLL